METAVLPSVTGIHVSHQRDGAGTWLISVSWAFNVVTYSLHAVNTGYRCICQDALLTNQNRTYHC